MKTPRHSIPQSHFSKQRGVALIITLAMVTMLAFLVVAFFSRATSNRLIESSSTSTTRADILANSAGNTVLADLQAEIVAGSNAIGTGSQPLIYQPLKPLNAVPALVRGSGISPTNTGYQNLVKQSVGRFFPTGANYPNGNPIILGDSGVTTDVASANGRTVTWPLWMRVVMTPGNGFQTASEIPRWILMSRQGVPAVQTWSNSFKDYTPGNAQAVIGRFAYNIYDEGGLLDVNVAGYPASSPAIPDSAVGQKGSLGMAQLGLIPGVTDPSLFSWDQGKKKGFRNRATGGTADNYLAYLGYTKNGATDLTANAYFNMGPKTGFKKAAFNTTTFASDNHLLGRQDLIRLAAKKDPVGTGSPTYGINDGKTLPTDDYVTTPASNSLAYLTHFSRELNAPMWKPDVVTVNNPDLATVRFTSDTTLTTYDLGGNIKSVDVKAGDPLIRQRFTLGRLRWLTYKGPNTTIANAAAAIKANFGLVWNASGSFWEYYGPKGTTQQSSIKNLTQVSAENRDPDFFEMLQAGIVEGSLGQSAETASLAKNSANSYTRKEFQIMRIGANIIDQADADNFPTVLKFGGIGTPADPGYDFYGIENLPYINELFPATYWKGQNIDDVKTNIGPVKWFLAFEMWNPHRADVETGLPGPTKIRLRLGNDTLFCPTYARTKAATTPAPPGATSYPPSNKYLSISGSIEADITATSFREPGMISDSKGPSYQSEIDCNAILLLSQPGLISDPPIPDEWYNPAGAPKSRTTNNPIWAPPSFQQMVVVLEYQDPVNNALWHPYSTFAGFENLANTGIYASNYVTLGTKSTPRKNLLAVYSKSDPRSARFGASYAYAIDDYPGGAVMQFQYDDLSSKPMINIGTSNRPAIYYTGMAQNEPDFGLPTYNGSSPDYADQTKWCPLGVLAENKKGTAYPNNLFYADPDGKYRPGDAFRTSDSTPVNPFKKGDDSARPVILNRPFRSVGELGYVFRDIPWKTLDFTSRSAAELAFQIDPSGDANLLDLFSIDDTSVVAGRVNLNTKNAVVLEAVLGGTAKVQTSTAPSAAQKLSASEAKDLAAEIVAFTTSTDPAKGPLKNRGEFLTKFDNTKITDAIKTQRESYVRALSEVSTARTWTLLIDVIAQSGRFVTTASSLDKFAVEGEKRYWLHVSIDRFTGKIIDQQLEAVNEF